MKRCNLIPKEVDTMKKHWKKLLFSFLALLLAAGGYILYIFKFKEYDVADEEVSEITKETYKIEMPDGTTIEFDEEGNMVESDGSSVSSDDLVVSAAENDDSDSSAATSDSNSGSSVSNGNGTGSSGVTNDATSGNSSTGGSSSNNGVSNSGNTGGESSGDSGESTNNEVTVAAIKDKYMPVMNQLSSQANARIDALVGRAVNEYQTKKANGESIDYGYFYNKYTSAASELEGRTDTVFYQMVGVVEKELEKNGFSKSHAKSFIQEYEAAKEARRKALLDKAINR